MFLLACSVAETIDCPFNACQWVVFSASVWSTSSSKLTSIVAPVLSVLRFWTTLATRGAAASPATLWESPSEL